ncbi:MAG TPA: hypothetical protein VHC69_17925 [Polyangiaceae bacterium]|nr:hypothetical protein [Polyangiaceae bacterium]
MSLALFCAALLPACGSSDDKTSTAKSVKKSHSTATATDAGDTSAAPDQSDDGDSGDGWQTIITGSWTLMPGTETYRCARVTVDRDYYVNAFEAINPQGTHHTLLTMGDADKPDGVIDCSVSELHPLEVFGSGVGTDPLTLPDGIAIHVPKGTQLLLNLHLFNTSEDVITGTSGTRIRTIPESAVTHIAEGVLAGTVNIDIPPGVTKVTTGYCTMPEDTTLIAVAPHMHQLGIYEKVTAQTAAQGDVVIHDAPYSFDYQSFHLINPAQQMAKGDKLRVDCTHMNTTPKEVTFGESSLAEMCFAGIYRYPAVGGFFICSDDLPSTPMLQ